MGALSLHQGGGEDAHVIQGCCIGKKAGVSNQPFYPAGGIDLRPIQEPLGTGVSSEGHAVMSVKVRPEPKDSGSEAREALWRESKTAEPS